MAAYLGDVAKKTGCANAVFPVNATDRNEPARTFLDQLARQCGSCAGVEGPIRIDATGVTSIQYLSSQSSVGTPAPRRHVDDSGIGEFLGSGIAGHIAEGLRSVDRILEAVDHQTCGLLGRGSIQAEAGTVQPPVTETERPIAMVWERVLGLPEVSVKANFFELGGTSLLLARVAIELQRDYHLAVSIVDLFQYPTIAELARHLEFDGSACEDGSRAASAAQRQKDVPGGQRVPAAFQRLKQSRGK